jgi:hypothetical protein
MKPVHELSNREIVEEAKRHVVALSFLRCDECAFVTYDLTWLGAIHQCDRRGAMRLVLVGPDGEQPGASR